ncbi:MAG TPA: right-handed parallel beta-helix repeat-containing protein, partial [Myxococcales bacterium]|nr:right-handed parallel beta-helix repeat-containing protein [Myxococcales bacterium]
MRQLVIAAVMLAACASPSTGSDPRSSDNSNGTTTTSGDPAASSATTPAAQPDLPPVTPPRPEFSRVLYVSPAGSDTAAGSEAAPFRTIHRALELVAPGEAVFVAAGTYPETLALDARAGLDGKPITLRGQGKPKLVPSGEGGGMVQFSRPGWVVEGFEIDAQGLGKIAVTFTSDVHGSVLRGNDIHGGTLGAGVTTYDGATGATIENNQIHDFWRDGEDAHGVLVQWTSRDITIRGNDIHHNSGDSVQCIGPETYADAAPASGVLIEKNDLHDGVENAVDIKTCSGVMVRGNRMHGFRMAPSGQGAKGDAVVIHMSASDVTVEDNEIYDSGRGLSLGGNRIGPMPAGVVIRHNRIHDIVIDGGTDGVGMCVENSEGARIEQNTFTRIASYALRVGGGTNGPTDNLRVRNNILDAASPVRVGSYAPGLVVNSNLYQPGALFTVQGVVESYQTWLTSGQDSRSVTGSPGFASADSLAPGPVAVDRGEDLGLTFCGAAPDLGAV